MEILTLPLPPSVNKAYYHNHDKHMTFYGREAKRWFEDAWVILTNWRVKNKFRPIYQYTYMDLHFVLPRRSCDAHNYLKVLCDGLQKNQIVIDDKFLLTRIQSVDFDSKNPRVDILFQEYHGENLQSSPPVR